MTTVLIFLSIKLLISVENSDTMARIYEMAYFSQEGTTACFYGLIHMFSTLRYTVDPVECIFRISIIQTKENKWVRNIFDLTEHNNWFYQLFNHWQLRMFLSLTSSVQVEVSLFLETTENCGLEYTEIIRVLLLNVEFTNTIVLMQRLPL